MWSKFKVNTKFTEMECQTQVRLYDVDPLCFPAYRRSYRSSAGVFCVSKFYRLMPEALTVKQISLKTFKRVQIQGYTPYG